LTDVAAEDYGLTGEQLTTLLLDGLASAAGARALDAWVEALPAIEVSPPLAEMEVQSRGRFLAAATELINQRGYHGASVDAICTQLGVTKGAFYHHLDGKNDLVLACFERSLSRMRALQAKAEAIAENGLHQLLITVDGLIRLHFDGQAPLLRMSALTSLPDGIQRQLLAGANSMSDGIAAQVRTGITDGSIRPVNEKLAAELINALINAAAEFPLYVPDIDAGQACRLFAWPMLKGLRP
jgi:AcrR family transcriptional regulator